MTNLSPFAIVKYAALVAMSACASDASQQVIHSHSLAVTGEPVVLSAFYGLDNGIPGRLFDCHRVGLSDGMPVVTNYEINQDTLDPSDIAVTMATGQTVAPACVTLQPADEENEDRTMLLIGEFGDPDSQPVRIDIVGDIATEPDDFGTVRNLNGASQAVIPLEDGPALVWAETMPASEQELGQANDCPNGTAHVVKTTWNGGVTGDNGAQLTDTERERMRVVVERADGTSVAVIPFALGDLNDRDNNVDLCLDVSDRPIRVDVEANTVTDPRNDWNDATSVIVTQ